MAAPKPLTACTPPALDWSRPGVPAAVDFGDIYFSTDGGLAETEAVYLTACGLPGRWEGRKTFTIGELGFGSGLNFLAAWRMWESARPKGGRLEFFSIEKFPFAEDELQKALTAWPELADYSERLIARWPGRVKGIHRLHLAKDVTLTLIHDDVLSGLRAVMVKTDAWFLDGFSPAKNPDMWSPDAMKEIARLSAPGAKIGTFTAAGMVRQGLADAGFTVSKTQGFGRKRHRLEAIYSGQVKTEEPVVRPVIIGGGIAGSSLAASFLRRGIVPTIIDAGDGTAASGNPAAIVKPRLDLQDRPESRFFLASYLHALQVYKDVDAVLSEGVFHAAKTKAELTRFEKLVRHAALPPAHMRLASGPYNTHGLSFPKAQIIDPKAACTALSAGAMRITGCAVRVETQGPDIKIRSKAGQVLASGTHVILALGAGVRDFQNAPNLELRFSRGQITAAKAACETALTYGGYAVPLGDSVLLGATHARLSGADPYTVTDDDDAANLESYKAITGTAATVLPGGSRASIRVNTKQTVPVVHHNGNGIIMLTGLGSRGFVFAPLLAENIVSGICGGVSSGEFLSFAE